MGTKKIKLDEQVDVIENKIYSLSPSLLSILLKDQTTKKNLRWATTTYMKYGELYSPERYIKAELLIGPNLNLLTPRVSKSSDEQRERTKTKGEVFTPSWICNMQINIVDEIWFNRKNVFNTETQYGWKTNKRKISFSKKLAKTWQDYVLDSRLEITCGEAPYLVSRYDVVKGNVIPVMDRIGILDRKLRIVNENVEDEPSWNEWAIKAYQSTYGFDYQGDNVLIARENLLYTFIDNVLHKYNHYPELSMLKRIANIISWNIWQMDGMSFTVPFSERKIESSQISLFDIDDEPSLIEPIMAKIKDWDTNTTIQFCEIAED